PDLDEMDGEDAMLLWDRWRTKGDVAARDLLVRYCAADVLLLVLLTHRLAGSSRWTDDNIWSRLPEPSRAPATGGLASAVPSIAEIGGETRLNFGSASPSKPRALRF